MATNINIDIMNWNLSDEIVLSSKEKATIEIIIATKLRKTPEPIIFRGTSV
jgi:hypothetical protein